MICIFKTRSVAIAAQIKARLKSRVPSPLWAHLRQLRDLLCKTPAAFSTLFLNPILTRLVLLKLKLSRKGQIDNYFANFQIRKLQLGAGDNDLFGWLNSEAFVPSSFTHSVKLANGYIFLDVCRPFPFKENSLDYIFHEHVFEHLDYHQGQFMLRECLRVLKPGGRMRMATPDLQVFVDAYGQQINDVQKLFLREYVRFNSELWSHDLTHVKSNEAAFVMNHNFRAWGHQFIYDYFTLAGALEAAGFQEVERHVTQESKDSHLCNLEIRKDIVCVLGSLIVEARKPQTLPSV